MIKDGFLNVHKPAGVSSHKCVMVVRKLFQTRQVGHGGTLDPMATGVLTMALGKATKFLQYLTSDKEYNGVIRFGVTTDSDDITGTILHEQAAPWLTEHDVQTALQRYVGSIDQIPPRVSAIKKDGVRLYELARTNQQMELQPRRVHIRRIDLHAFRPGAFPEADIRVVCGAGTYIRSIARECGEALVVPRSESHNGDAATTTIDTTTACVGGTLAALERSRSGIFSLDSSLSFDAIRTQLETGANPLQPIASALEHLASVELAPAAAHKWQVGGIAWIRSTDVVPGNSDSSASSDVAHCSDYALADRETVRVFSSATTPPTFLGVSQVERQQNKPDAFVLRTRSFA